MRMKHIAAVIIVTAVLSVYTDLCFCAGRGE